MTPTKKEVFLASRFEEFAELRSLIKAKIDAHRSAPIAVIDLNDGAVTHRPPLAECLSHVRRAEFMILLLGDTYGGLAPHSDKSFTHLEYEEAIREGSSTRVLVFGIGACYLGGRLHYSDDPRLAAWQRQVNENHTIGYYDKDVPVENLAQAIHEQLLFAWAELSSASPHTDAVVDLPEELISDLDDDGFVDEDEVKLLDARYSTNEIAEDDGPQFKDELSALLQPAAVAAQEQRMEAFRALELDQYAIAVQHLQRALDFKPLDRSGNYWLAQLYVASGKKQKAREAIKLAERAARLAEVSGRPFSESAAWVIAARAARLADDSEYALKLAKLARDTANYALAFVEYARQLVLEGRLRDAMDEIRAAFAIRPQSLSVVFADPSFRPIRQDVSGLYQERKERMAKDLSDLLGYEGDIAKLSASSAPSTPPATEAKSTRQLIELGRQSVKRQYDSVCLLLKDADSKVRELASSDSKPAPIVETFTFQRPGSVQVTLWNKKPGEVIQPGEAVFQYRYQKNAPEKTWTLRSNETVRMVDRAGPDGTYVSSEKPFLFSYRPTDFEHRESRVGQIREGIAGRETILARLQNDLSATKDVEAQFRRTRDSMQTAPADRVLPPIFAIGLLGTLAAIGLYTRPGFGAAASVALLLAWSLVGVGMHRYRRLRQSRLEWKTKMSSLNQRLGDLANQRSHSEQLIETQLVNLRQLQTELQAIEAACEQAIEIAKRALGVFEGRTLRKSGMHPFSRPQRAKEADIIRLSEDGLDRMGKLRRVEIRQDMPNWLGETQESTKGPRLLFVLEANADHVTLSRARAYMLRN